MMVQEAALTDMARMGPQASAIAATLAVAALSPQHLLSSSIGCCHLGWRGKYWWFRNHICLTLCTHLDDPEILQESVVGMAR